MPLQCLDSDLGLQAEHLTKPLWKGRFWQKLFSVSCAHFFPHTSSSSAVIIVCCSSLVYFQESTSFFECL